MICLFVSPAAFSHVHQLFATENNNVPKDDLG